MCNWFDISGRAALVTGSNRGLGLALATGLAKAGAHVTLQGRDAAKVSQAAQQLSESLGVSVGHLVFDVTDAQQTQAALNDFMGNQGMAIIGAGSIGSLTAGAAQTLGAKVSCIDIQDAPLEHAQSLGVDQAYNSNKTENEGANFDTVMECAGVFPAISQALQVCRPSGTVVQARVVSTIDGSVNVAPLLSKEITYLGLLRFVTTSIRRWKSWIILDKCNPPLHTSSMRTKPQKSFTQPKIVLCLAK